MRIMLVVVSVERVTIWTIIKPAVASFHLEDCAFFNRYSPFSGDNLSETLSVGLYLASRSPPLSQFNRKLTGFEVEAHNTAHELYRARYHRVILTLRRLFGPTFMPAASQR